MSLSENGMHNGILHCSSTSPAHPPPHPPPSHLKPYLYAPDHAPDIIHSRCADNSLCKHG